MLTKKIIKNLIAFTSAASLLLSAAPVYAGTYNTDGSATVPITATVAGSYSITLPALIECEFIDKTSGGNQYVMLNSNTQKATVEMDLQKSKFLQFGYNDENAYLKVYKDGVATDLYVNPGLKSYYINGTRTQFQDELVEAVDEQEVNLHTPEYKPELYAPGATYADDLNTLYSMFTANGNTDMFFRVDGQAGRFKSDLYKYDEGTTSYVNWSRPDGGTWHTFENLVADYGPGVYTATLHFTWATKDIPASLLK